MLLMLSSEDGEVEDVGGPVRRWRKGRGGEEEQEKSRWDELSGSMI
jgi:hypothetical protein